MKLNVEFNVKSFFQDVGRTYTVGLKKAWRYLLKHWLKSLIVMIIFLLLAIFVSFTSAFFLSFFLAFLLMRLDSRVPIGFALACLIVCPFLLLFHYQLVAEQFAIWAYYFLVIGVVLQIVEFIREPKVEKAKTEEMAVPEQEKIYRASEGVILKPVVKTEAASEGGEPRLEVSRRETKKEPKPARRAVLIITLVIISIIVCAGGGIILFRYYNASQMTGVSSTTPAVEKETSKPVTSQIDKAVISIVVLNGNGVPGSAAKMKQVLENAGFKVSAIGDAEIITYPETIIRYQPGSKEKADLIIEALKGKYSAKAEETTVSQEAEILMIVGIK